MTDMLITYQANHWDVKDSAGRSNIDMSHHIRFININKVEVAFCENHHLKEE